MTIVNALDEEITRWEKVQTEVFKLRPIISCVPIKEFRISKCTAVFSLKAYFRWNTTLDRLESIEHKIRVILQKAGYNKLTINYSTRGGYLLVQVRVTNRKF